MNKDFAEFVKNMIDCLFSNVLPVDMAGDIALSFIVEG
jgi:hypothetical protein